MPVPDFSPGEVLTAAAMDSIGLWKIAETSFTTTATPFIDGCFSADFEHYLAIFRMTSSAQGQYTNIQLRNGTTPKATNYNRAGFLFTTGGVTSSDSSATGQDGFRLTGQSTAGIYATAEFFRPFTTSETGYKSSSSYQQGVALTYAGAQTESYSATGFQVISSGNSVTYTGTIRIYGYRN
jgi:hypothetical protein